MSPDHTTALSNNGMHPTADTIALNFQQWLGAAGDAGRYAASVRNPKGTHDRTNLFIHCHPYTYAEVGAGAKP